MITCRYVWFHVGVRPPRQITRVKFVVALTVRSPPCLCAHIFPSLALQDQWCFPPSVKMIRRRRIWFISLWIDGTRPPRANALPLQSEHRLFDPQPSGRWNHVERRRAPLWLLHTPRLRPGLWTPMDGALERDQVLGFKEASSSAWRNLFRRTLCHVHLRMCALRILLPLPSV